MKTQRLHFLILLFLSGVSLSSIGLAQEKQDPGLQQALSQMRLKQQDEENSTVVRVIQQPMVVQTADCSPSELVRQRLRDLGGSQTRVAGSINVEAGHGEVRVDDNHGSINNSVNVQVNAPGGDRKCF